jgi:hypothetical protein
MTTKRPARPLWIPVGLLAAAGLWMVLNPRRGEGPPARGDAGVPAAAARPAAAASQPAVAGPEPDAGEPDPAVLPSGRISLLSERPADWGTAPPHPDFTAIRFDPFEPIRGTAGQVLFRPESGEPITRIRSRSDAEHLLISSNEGRATLIHTIHGDPTPLPHQPPDSSLLPLKWDWLDRDTLLGISEVPFVEPPGHDGVTCGCMKRGETRLFVYHIPSRSLEPLPLPDDFAGRHLEVGSPGADRTVPVTSFPVHGTPTAFRHLWIHLAR